MERIACSFCSEAIYRSEAELTTLITGASGFVGNNVARMLVERGEKVRVLVALGAICDRLLIWRLK